ncbi:MAG: rod-binding protein [Nitrospirae bacterium]|nr:rod-binding protein [Nitrospirota bacterium]
MSNIQNTQQIASNVNSKTQRTEQKIHKPEIKKAAKEMEALFVYELIKVMRETTEGMSSDSKGLGSETYMGLFDMEVSRVMADKGVGIQDAIVNWLERSPNNKINDNDNKK